MRRRPVFPFWILLFFPFGFGFFGLFEAFFPLLFLGIIIYTVVTLINNKERGNRRTTRTYSNGRSRQVNPTENFSNSELVRVDEKLQQYFEKSVELKIDSNVSLTTSNGKYTSLGQLFLTYGGEKITRMSEFKQEHPDVYSKIVGMLIKFSKQRSTPKAEVKSEPVKEVKKEEKKLNKAEYFINKINELNEAIPHEELSNGMDQTCQLLKQISLACKGKEEDDKLKKLYEYYLPMLVNALEKYRELNDSPVHGEEFTKCENELMKTIILINQALKSLYNSLHEYEYMDLNADISTLQSILKKDGLVDDNPFKENDDE